MKKKISLLVGSFCFCNLFAQNADYQAYIEKYSDIAVQQQQRHGIPASITLSQALLESGAGKSPLAKASNNHFGIKCTSDWTGGRFNHDDDKAGECFRVYNAVLDSYEDHSAFLKRERYAKLYTYKVTDYKSWAFGLKAAGYATDPKYPAKLIQIIEDYRLYRYDNAQLTSAKKIEPKAEPEKVKKVEKQESADDFSYEDEFFAFEEQNMYAFHKVLNVNDLQYVELRENENLQSIAEEFSMRENELLRYNELPKDSVLKEGARIFLQPKKSKFSGKTLNHRVDFGESMHSISQKYGIKMARLYKINGIKKWEPAQYGRFLKLR